VRPSENLRGWPSRKCFHAHTGTNKCRLPRRREGEGAGPSRTAGINVWPPSGPCHDMAGRPAWSAGTRWGEAASALRRSPSVVRCAALCPGSRNDEGTLLQLASAEAGRRGTRGAPPPLSSDGGDEHEASRQLKSPLAVCTSSACRRRAHSGPGNRRPRPPDPRAAPHTLSLSLSLAHPAPNTC